MIIYETFILELINFWITVTYYVVFLFFFLISSSLFKILLNYLNRCFRWNSGKLSTLNLDKLFAKIFIGIYEQFIFNLIFIIHRVCRIFALHRLNPSFWLFIFLLSWKIIYITRTTNQSSTYIQRYSIFFHLPTFASRNIGPINLRVKSNFQFR